MRSPPLQYNPAQSGSKGMQSTVGMKSVPADMIVFDELDETPHWTLRCPACNNWLAPAKEFPTKLGEEVPFIKFRPDESHYLACVKCGAELDLGRGEWVADFPNRDIHGYRISQLFSSKIDPGEILQEYRTTRFPDRFYNLKIGIPWADLERRLDESAVLSLCTDYVMGRDCDRAYRFMGVDTGKNLHVVIMATHNDLKSPMVIHLETCHE
ncbi:MAG: phage terminase large subunit family protein, partial [Candidatus Eisenbacteria bacterium]|nr:phage terminase large subunit family protein [Candidatus Eisenbacteria bacterium]